MIHTLDVAFGIVHDSMPMTGSSTVNPMLEMRESLPNEFQEFIKALANAPSIRDFCLLHPTSDVAGEFNRACKAIKDFRDLHIQVATRYIILQSKEKNLVGTGGTNLIPFLKQTRQETEDAMIPPI